jgi:hypothetical protein
MCKLCLYLALHDCTSAKDWSIFHGLVRSVYEPRLSYFFFSGEGPRSRRYGRTAAMRLIVQPYNEDEDDDYFLCFS